MHYRFHNGSKRNPSGKWEHRPRTGVGHVAYEEIGDWTIELSHRQVGVTIKRDQFSVTIRRQSSVHEELLSGFSSKMTAMAAARKRVDLLSHMRDPVVGAPHRGQANRVRRE